MPRLRRTKPAKRWTTEVLLAPLSALAAQAFEGGEMKYIRLAVESLALLALFFVAMWVAWAAGVVWGVA